MIKSIFEETNTDEILMRLLCYGYFPKKLSRIFSTISFGEWVISENLEVSVISSKLMKFKVTRNNNSLRFFNIPQPLSYINLSKSLVDNWKSICSSFRDIDCYNDKCMLVPNFENEDKRLTSFESYDRDPDTELNIVENQMNKKYFIKSDITNFFPSIYSHSIPWALVGKKKSKETRRQNDKWYNVIDRALRNCQDCETIGIPIGPDTSNIISEIILSQIDMELKDYSYLRYVDDFKCFCSSKKEAERFLIDLSKALEEKRLILNKKKTKIYELPQSIDSEWVSILRHFQLENKENKLVINKKNVKKFIDYLDLAASLINQFPDDSPLKYGIKRISKAQFEDIESFQIILLKICNLAYLFPYIIDIIDRFIDNAPDIDGMNSIFRKILKDYIKAILIDDNNFSKSDVIVWAFFLTIKYDLEIEDFSMIQDKVISYRDPIPTLMSYLYSFIKGLNCEVYLDLINDSNIEFDEWWLYIYEISRFNNINDKLQNYPVEKKEFFTSMRNAGISFLSVTLHEKVMNRIELIQQELGDEVNSNLS